MANPSKLWGSARTRRALVGVGGLAVLLLIFWHSIQQKIQEDLLVKSHAPAREFFEEVLGRARHPDKLLARLWATQRIPSRQLVMSYLAGKTLEDPHLIKALENLVIDATMDVDVDVRRSAFAILRQQKNPQIRTLVMAQLDDIDPAIRILGLQTLSTFATSNDLWIVERAVEDTDPRVVVAVGPILNRVIGRDLGFRSHEAMPIFAQRFFDTVPAPPNTNAISKSIALWRAWASTNQDQIRPPAAHPVSSIPRRYLPVLERELKLSSGTRLALPDRTGRTTILAFYDDKTPPGQITSLEEILRANSNRVSVIGVKVPLSIACDACADDSSADDGSHHAHHEQENISPVVALTHVPQFPVVDDEKAKLSLGFGNEDLPVYVFIDRNGIIRRKVMGICQKNILEKALHETVAEVAPATASPAR